MMNRELGIKLERAYRILYGEGLAEDASRGHVSVRSGGERIYVKPWGTGFEEVRARDFQELDMEGNLLAGRGRIHSEMVLHFGIYRRRKDVAAVIHVHPFYSILLSSLFTGKITVLSQHGVRFAGKLPFYPSAALIQSREPAEKLARLLGDQPVILMKNHGITVAGRSIEEAVVLAIHFEAVAKEHLTAHLFGKPSGMPVAEAKKICANNYTLSQYGMIWEYYWKKYKQKCEGGAGR